MDPGPLDPEWIPPGFDAPGDRTASAFVDGPGVDGTRTKREERPRSCADAAVRVRVDPLVYRGLSGRPAMET